VTVSLGQVAATLAGTAAGQPGGVALLSPTLNVTESGRAFLSQPVTAPAGATAVIPMNLGSTTNSSSDLQPLCLARFQGTNKPTVLLGFYLGGAHCCTVVRAVPLSSNRDGQVVDGNFGNPQAAVIAEGDHAVIVTADDAFSYRFSDYAHSGTPIRVLEIVQGKFVNTTPRYKQLVDSDARKWMSLFNSQPGNGLGYLAAWVADECVVGQDHQAWRTVGLLQQQGKLVGGDIAPGGQAFVNDLRQFLSQQGYCLQSA
jgi:hypothetical protein